MPDAKALGSYAGRLANASTSPFCGSSTTERAVEAGDPEAIFDGLLQIEVERQLQPLALDRILFVERPDFAADAVHHDAPGAVDAHQQRVVDLLDARLADDVAALQALVLADLLVAHFADVAERVRGELVRDIVASALARPARPAVPGERAPDGGHLRDRRILHDRHRPVRRLAAMPVDGLANARFFVSENRGQHPNRAIQILAVLAHDRDAEGGPVLDEDAAVAVQDDAARRAQRQACADGCSRPSPRTSRAARPAAPRS